MSDTGRDQFRRERTSTTRDGVSALPGSRECFADETAIDFPAVDCCVERARAAFADERGGRTLVAEVSLSRREAATGAVVPLALPLSGTCASCGGRGEVWGEPCGACAGAGQALVHHAVRLTVPSGVADGTRFRFRVSAPDLIATRVEIRVTVVGVPRVS